jgi:hypothetical protein
MAVGNKLGLTDEDYDARVSAASAGAYSASAIHASAGSAADGDTAAAHDVSSTSHDGTHFTDDDKRQAEALLRAQIEMDLQRTMPRCFENGTLFCFGLFHPLMQHWQFFEGGGLGGAA